MTRLASAADPLHRVAAIDSAWHRLDARISQLMHARGGPDRRDLELAELLRVMAASLAAGRSLQGSIADAAERIAGPVSTAAHRCGARLALGSPLDDALAGFAREVRTPAAEVLADVLRIRHRHGGSLGDVCHRLAALLHDRVRLRAEARSATAQARFSARAVLGVPFLLVAAGLVVAPAAVERMLAPGMLLLALPGLLGIAAGALLVRSVARRSCDLDAPPAAGSAARASRLGRLIDGVAGAGPRSLQSVRLGLAALAAAVPLLVASGASPTPLVASAACIACAVLRPWSVERLRRRSRARIVDHGIDTLLEVSIALLAAGATIPEVVRGAVHATPEPLRSALLPAADLAALGRAPHLAFGGVAEVAGSPELGAWMHALRTGAELGAPAAAVLETVLRDVRSHQRERIRQAAATAGPRIQLATVLFVVPGVMWLMLLATVSGLVRQLAAGGF